MKEINAKLFDYIENCPTAYNAAEHTAKILESAGYSKLNEAATWTLETGKGYYVTRNGSSLIAFRVPNGDFTGFMMTAAHLDSPTFRIKENDRLEDGNYVKLSVEGYGGMLRSTWTDRPLSVAGRLVVKTDGGIKTVTVDLKEPVAIIPNVAIHMDRTSNDSKGYNTAVDMIPLFSLAGEKTLHLREMLAKAAKVDEKDIVATDVSVYNPQSGEEFGGVICAPRLDDLQCAFASLTAFLNAKDGAGLPVLCLFDNEEVGSGTKQGADSATLGLMLEKIACALGASRSEYIDSLASGFMLSCDVAHAKHPNHAELSDASCNAVMNKGTALKMNYEQRYATEAVGIGMIEGICAKYSIPYQRFMNRPDLRGGGTLGSFAASQLGMSTADVGVPMLAMHSCRETMGVRDQDSLNELVAHYFAEE